LDRLKKEEFFFNDFGSDERGLIGWKLSRFNKETGSQEDEILYTEELIAVTLKLGKQMSEKQANT
jgi:hypothetical protein